MLLRWSLSIDEVWFCNENEVKMRLKKRYHFRNILSFNNVNIFDKNIFLSFYDF